MRDLSRFGAQAFDVVWHAHSITFVPDVHTVFAEVQRVLRTGGLYHVLFRVRQRQYPSPKSRFRFPGSVSGWIGSSWAMLNCTTRPLSQGNAVRLAFSLSSNGWSLS